MRRRIALASITAVSSSLLVAASPATAGKTRTLVGTLNDQPDSSVSMKVKLNNENRPKFVKDFAISGVDLLCDDGTGSLVTRTFDLEVPGRMRIGGFQSYLKTVENFDGAGSDIQVGGRVVRKGKLSTGGLETQRGSDCHGAPSFVARKR
jgi:hypothetical protein